MKLYISACELPCCETRLGFCSCPDGSLFASPSSQKAGLRISPEAVDAAHRFPSEARPDFSAVADPKKPTWSRPKPAGQPEKEEELMDPTGSHSATNNSD